MSEATDAATDTAEGGREIPPPGELTASQYKGWSCVWCGTPLTHGGRPVGVTRGRDGAHVLDAPVYAGPCCP
ncbi:hypothetical protein [Streptomyces lavendofoliae]|uniref:Uncharacterized protein n=1 Tax=Streptomyces lavendofoliae TaxID=67314 RepID=A0A918M6Z6_9ACTN|nr:hypothetical protein [Streptomyces lavendofoliae]GGU54739.1 hypothetical protein GCM10010274_49560 [Streptomyces lavendofoliae]